MLRTILCFNRCLADRAKQIKVHAKVNQDQTDKLIKQLREENEKLKNLMSSGAQLPGAVADKSAGN